MLMMMMIEMMIEMMMIVMHVHVYGSPRRTFLISSTLCAKESKNTTRTVAICADREYYHLGSIVNKAILFAGHL